MKCPRCGAFMDNNKTICFMCGATLNNNGGGDANSNLNSNDNQTFNGFNNANPFANSFDNNNSVNSNSSISNGDTIGDNGFDSFSMNNRFDNPSMNNNSNNVNFNNFANSNFDNQNGVGFNDPKVESKPAEDINNKIFNRREEIKVNDDYKNIKLEDIKTDKDVFDFFSEHKKGIKIFFLLLLFAGIGFGVFMFVKHKMSAKENEPIIGNLYFEIDDSFDLIQNSSTQYVYSLSGAKGSDCSITISNGTTTSGNHVLDYFNENVNKHAPSKDRDGNVINPLDDFKAETSEVELNDHLWSRQYFYYRTDLSAVEYTLLKKMFLSSMYKGFYYDIELVNNTNSTTCNVELDSFINSLEFVDVDKK